MSLVLLLQHVPQSQRLGSCALVNKAWAEAAAEATTHAELWGERAQWAPPSVAPALDVQAWSARDIYEMFRGCRMRRRRQSAD